MSKEQEKKKVGKAGGRGSYTIVGSLPREGLPTRRKEQPMEPRSETDGREIRQGTEETVEAEVEAEAAAVVAAVPGHQGTVTRAQALLDCSWCGLHNEEGRGERKR